jgi:hypothetical protein
MISQSEVNMKKFFKISLIVVLTLAIAFTVFSVTTTNSAMAAGKICPSVGWNTRSDSCSFGAVPSLEGFARQFPPDIMPNVGWNT